MTTGTASNVTTGPGTLYCAPIGTTEPASATATLDVAWRDVGYTDGGIKVSYEITSEGVFVDQEFDPLRYYSTARSGMVSTNLAEINRRNLALALNVGAAATATGSLEPPAPGAEVRVMLLHQTDDGARWIFRRCLQASAIEIGSEKAPAKRVIPVQFKLEKPDSVQPFIVWPSLTTAGLV